jgi:hypothetical protein
MQEVTLHAQRAIKDSIRHSNGTTLQGSELYTRQKSNVSNDTIVGVVVEHCLQ